MADIVPTIFTVGSTSILTFGMLWSLIQYLDGKHSLVIIRARWYGLKSD